MQNSLLLKKVLEKYWNCIPNIECINTHYTFKRFKAFLPPVIVDRILYFDDPKELKKLDQDEINLFYEFNDKKIKDLGGKVFPKICNKSSCEIKFYFKNKYVTNGKDFIKNFIDDVEVYEYIYLLNRAKQNVPYELIQYIPLQPMLEEVRLFIINKEIAFSTQYCTKDQIESGKVKLISKERIKKAELFYKCVISHQIKEEMFVADIGFTKKHGDPILIEFNPLFQSHLCMLEE